MKKIMSKWKHATGLILCFLLIVNLVMPTQAKTNVKKLTFSRKNITLTIGTKKKLSVKTTPKKAQKAIKWKTSNKRIATVTKKGVVTAKKAGTCKITAYIGNKKAVCRVKVKPVIPVQKPAATTQKPVQTTEAPKQQEIEHTPASGNPDNNTLDLKRVDELVNSGKIEISQNTDTTIRGISGNFSTIKIANEDDAKEVLYQVAPVIGSEEDSLGDLPWDVAEESIQNKTDGKENYYVLTPSVVDVPVEGSNVIIQTDKNGLPQGLYNSYNKAIEEIDTVADEEIDEDNEVIDVVKSHLKSMWLQADSSAETQIDELLESLNYSESFVIDAIDKNTEPCLAWKVRVTSFTESEGDDRTLDELSSVQKTNMLNQVDMTVYVGANGNNSAEVLRVISGTDDMVSDTTDNATDFKGNTRTINVKNNNGTLELHDRIRGIQSYQTLYKPSMFSVTSYLPGRIISKGASWNKKGVSIHANMAKVYDYYNNNLGRKSYDGSGAPIISSIEYVDDANIFQWLKGVNYNNAYWAGGLEQFVFYNGGNNEAALDVCGHEYTHAVINTIVGGKDLGTSLTYQGESGALNESYADIMGSLIEGKTGAAKWTLAEDGKETFRDMSDPSFYNQPEHYDNRYTGTDDNGGVHINSGIFNFAAYKMMTDTRNSNVTSTTWSRIFYNSLYKLNTDADFLDARFAVISAAKDLGFTSNQQQAIKEAFDAVGISEPETIRIVLTWGSQPEDLDSHLTGPIEKSSSRYHIYFSGQTSYCENGSYEDEYSNYIADLDYDDTDPYGTEITSIRILTEGDYYFYVHDYTNRSESYSKEMAGSNAYVKIYEGTGNKLKKLTDGKTDAIFRVNSNQPGTLWTVMRIHIDSDGKSSIYPINTYGYEEYPDSIGQ